MEDAIDFHLSPESPTGIVIEPYELADECPGSFPLMRPLVEALHTNDPFGEERWNDLIDELSFEEEMASLLEKAELSNASMTSLNVHSAHTIMIHFQWSTTSLELMTCLRRIMACV
jgi:hypothetical protein